ncbi:hypothetical protein B0H19DRAFT_1267303 [Mycena capillaripes]|nr:hypothetical protein B0H19DRAFT_1267303 [Mycena capillaripes]
MADTIDNIPFTFTIGALIGGCMTAVGPSAIVGFQTFIYFQLFRVDALHYKCLVAWIWITDTGHTIAICTTIWQCVVRNFENPEKLHEIVIATMNANPYVLHVENTQELGGFTLLFGLADFLILGFFIASEMLIAENWATIAAHFKVVEISGWAVSGATDVVISAARYYYLHELKQGYISTREMVDAVVIFIINDGLLTCATVIAVITCFLSMPNDFIWTALFFTLAKLFSNSVLTT